MYKVCGKIKNEMPTDFEDSFFFFGWYMYVLLSTAFLPVSVQDDLTDWRKINGDCGLWVVAEASRTADRTSSQPDPTSPGWYNIAASLSRDNRAGLQWLYPHCTTTVNSDPPGDLTPHFCALSPSPFTYLGSGRTIFLLALLAGVDLLFSIAIR